MQLIKVSGEITEYEDTSLAGMQKAVGGYIETVPTNTGKILILNEDGKMIGLPENVLATALTRGILADTDFIVGDVLLADHSELN